MPLNAIKNASNKPVPELAVPPPKYIFPCESISIALQVSMFSPPNIRAQFKVAGVTFLAVLAALFLVFALRQRKQTAKRRDSVGTEMAKRDSNSGDSSSEEEQVEKKVKSGSKVDDPSTSSAEDDDSESVATEAKSETKSKGSVVINESGSTQSGSGESEDEAGQKTGPGLFDPKSNEPEKATSDTEDNDNEAILPGENQLPKTPTFNGSTE